MKDHYIKQVGKKLAVPRAKRKEILRDLEEIFLTAQEHGEDEQQVIDRLGAPEEFAQHIEESFGSNGPVRRKTAAAAGIGILCAVAVICFSLYGTACATRVPEEAIGYAQGSTDIAVNGAVNMAAVLPVIGVGALIGLSVQLYRLLRRK